MVICSHCIIGFAVYSSLMDIAVSIAMPNAMDNGTQQASETGDSEVVQVLYGLPASFDQLYVKGGMLSFLPSWARELITLCVDISDEILGEQTPRPADTALPSATPRRTVSFAPSPPTVRNSAGRERVPSTPHPGDGDGHLDSRRCSSEDGDGGFVSDLTADLSWVWTLLEIFLGYGNGFDMPAHSTLEGDDVASHLPAINSSGDRYNHLLQSPVRSSTTALSSSATALRPLHRPQASHRDGADTGPDIPAELLQVHEQVGHGQGYVDVAAGADNPGLRSFNILQPLTQADREARREAARVRHPQSEFGFILPQAPSTPVISLDDYAEEDEVDEEGEEGDVFDMLRPGRRVTMSVDNNQVGNNLEESDERLCPRRLRYRNRIQPPADGVILDTNASSSVPARLLGDMRAVAGNMNEVSPLQYASAVFRRQLSAQIDGVKREIASQLFHLASGGSAKDSLLLESLVASGLAHVFFNICALLLHEINLGQPLTLIGSSAAPESTSISAVSNISTSLPLSRGHSSWPSHNTAHISLPSSPPSMLQRVTQRLLSDYLCADYVNHSCQFVYSVYSGNYDFSRGAATVGLDRIGLVKGGLTVLGSAKVCCGYTFAYSFVTLLIRHHDAVLKYFCTTFSDSAASTPGTSPNAVSNIPVAHGVDVSTGAPVYRRRISQSEQLYRSVVERLLTFLKVVGVNGSNTVGRSGDASSTGTTIATITTTTTVSSTRISNCSFGPSSVVMYLSVLSVLFTYLVANHFRRRGLGFKFHTLEWLQKCFLIKLRRTYSQLVETVAADAAAAEGC